jgi:hypothetical protein
VAPTRLAGDEGATSQGRREGCWQPRGRGQLREGGAREQGVVSASVRTGRAISARARGAKEAWWQFHRRIEGEREERNEEERVRE